jgi:hypothetical protein
VVAYNEIADNLLYPVTAARCPVSLWGAIVHNVGIQTRSAATPIENGVKLLRSA